MSTCAKWLLALVLAFGAACAFAAEADAGVRPFVRGSQRQIVSAHAGRPFILAFWSITCTNCRDDLALFGKLVKKYPDLELILVATDAPAQSREIAQTLQRYNLGRAESWVFADGFAERLRYEVDAQWYGELPRTYFYDAQGHILALSGVLDYAETERWIRDSRKRG